MFVNILFILFVVLYVIIAVTVEKWFILLELRRFLMVPEAFLKNQTPYFAVQYLLLFFALILGFFVSFFPWYISIISLIIIWQTIPVIALKNAFAAIRKSAKQLLQYEIENNNDPDMIKSLTDAINRSDEEYKQTWKIFRKFR